MFGINVLNYYFFLIFQVIGFIGIDVGFLVIGIFGIVKVGVIIVFMIWGIECIGCCNVFFIGFVGVMIVLFYIGVFVKVIGFFEVDGDVGGKSFGVYVVIVMIYVFVVFYVMFWNGIFWIFW